MYKLIIYDYRDTPTIIELKEKPEKLLVNVIAGDEVVIAVFSDDSVEQLDSSSTRIMDFYDGSYIVDKDAIDSWNNFEFVTEEPKSYERMEALL